MILSKKRGFLLPAPALLLLLLIIMPEISALGVSPSRVSMNFEPNFEYEGEACFSPQGITRLKIEPNGETGQYLTIKGTDENGEIDAAVNNCISYKLKLPERFDKPGLKQGGISALEISDESYGNVQVRVRIHHQIWVFVPYPGKYLEITSFEAGNVKAGGTVPFTVNIQSKGDETIEEAEGRIYIYKSKNQIGVIDTNVARNLELDQARVLNAKWDSTGYKEGNYEAFADITYDGQEVNATAEFKLGGLDTNLANYTRELVVGQIKEFYARVDSIWDEPLQGVRVVANVYNSSKQAQPLATVETVTRTLQPWANEELKGFLDISSLNVGAYDMKLTLYFAEMGSANEMIKKYNDTLRIVPEPPKPIEKKPSIFSRFASAKLTTKIMIGSLLLLLILAIGFLIYILLPKNKRIKG
jgi:hypothetical protein